MKRGFAKKAFIKEDITRDRDKDPKGLLAGLGIIVVVLGGVTAGLHSIEKNKMKKS